MVDRQEGRDPADRVLPYVGYGARFYDPAAATGAPRPSRREPGDVAAAPSGGSGSPKAAWIGYATDRERGRAGRRRRRRT